MNMKKINNILLAIFIAGFFVACDKKAESSADSNTKTIIKVGATPNPHAKILENIKSDLNEQGIELQIVEFSDYVQPNLALEDGSLDANFHQHKPFLDKMIEDKKLHLSPIAKVHVEPLGLYSQKVKNINEFKKGSTIAIPNDPSNGGRALILLHNNGLLKLKDPNNLLSTDLDILDDSLVKIKRLDAPMLPKILSDVDGAVINGNFALQANLSAKDALVLEDSRSPYANILVVKAGNENNPSLIKLKEALNSEKTKKFIEENYKGEIVVAF